MRASEASSGAHHLFNRTREIGVTTAIPRAPCLSTLCVGTNSSTLAVHASRLVFNSVSFEKSSNFVNYMEQNRTIEKISVQNRVATQLGFQTGQNLPGVFECDGEGAGDEAGVRNLLRKLCSALHCRF